MKNILIVDDEPHVIRILRLVLEEHDYEVISATDGEEALGYIEKKIPDVMITDLSMPRMDGRKLCQTIQQNYPLHTFLILVMTSCTEREEIAWMNNISNIEFLEKPLSPTRLAARLKEYFNESEKNLQKAHE